MAPSKTSIREQLASLETSIAHGLKRSRYDESARKLGLITEEPVIKKLCIDKDTGADETPVRGNKPEEVVDDTKDGGDDVNRDSDAGMFIQAATEGPYEPLVLWPPEDDGSTSSGNIVQVPASINSRLLDHQREGVKFLYNLYRQNHGGILGDDMGLGKTIQSIALIAAILGKDVESFQPFYVSVERRKVVLILCPTSVISNWEREFEAWGSFAVGVFHGAHRDLIVEKVRKNQFDVVLTSHDTFRIHGNSLQNINWDCVFVDEAHRLKNEKSKLYQACCKLRTKARFGLTGTILQNKLLDLFNVFEWAAPGCLGTKEHFRNFYDEPIKQGQRISAPKTLIELAEKRRQSLLTVLQKYSLRRTKQETIGHLLRGKEDIIAFCAMSPVQKRVYARLLESPDFQCLVRKDEKCSCGSMEPSSKCCFRTAPNGIIWPFLHKNNPDGCDHCPFCLVLPCLTKLQQVSNHLELLKPNSNDDTEKRKRDRKFASIVFGDDAPCLGGVDPDESFLGLSESQNCGKMVALKKLLSNWTSQGDKVLLFSYSVRMLCILEKFLIRQGYCFCRLDGSTPMHARQAIVDEFNTSPAKQVFLISTRAGGLGLNLVSANRVVVFDPNWNPAQDLQAQDRSFRFGQKRHVTVFRLLAAGSLEELVYTRQIYKQQLFNLAVTGTNEKRYFEGVQDSKHNQGELFGVTNLFRDLKDKVFTSDIIEQHEERLMNLELDDYDEGRCSKGKADIECEEDDEHGMSGLAQLLRENMQWSQDAGDNSKGAELDDMLTNAGVVYAHRNEKVVNIGRRRESEKLEDKDEEFENQTKKTVSKVRQKVTEKSSATVQRSRRKEELATQKRKKADKKVKAEPAKVQSKELFTELAEFKGLDLKHFSEWMVSASQSDREELLARFRRNKPQ